MRVLKLVDCSGEDFGVVANGWALTVRVSTCSPVAFRVHADLELNQPCDLVSQGLDMLDISLDILDNCGLQVLWQHEVWVLIRELQSHYTVKSEFGQE